MWLSGVLCFTHLPHQLPPYIDLLFVLRQVTSSFTPVVFTTATRGPPNVNMYGYNPLTQSTSVVFCECGRAVSLIWAMKCCTAHCEKRRLALGVHWLVSGTVPSKVQQLYPLGTYFYLCGLYLKEPNFFPLVAILYLHLIDPYCCKWE